MVSKNGTRRRTALVTGASSGIGSEFARLLAERDHDLVLVARRTAKLEELAKELEQRHDARITVLTTDLSETNAAQEVYSQVLRRGIEVDVLVNNAGFNVYGPFSGTDPEKEMRMLQVNIMALVALTKLFVRGMIDRGYGKILNLGSTGSFAPAPLDGLYAASKAFVLSFSEAIAEELKGTGVTVTALCPGPTQTEFAAKAAMTDTKIFSGRLMSAQQVVSIGYQGLMRDEAVVVPGWANNFQVWSMRFAPRSLVRQVAKGLMSRKPVTLHPTLSAFDRIEH
jgi:uncharacterized protein